MDVSPALLGDGCTGFVNTWRGIDLRVCCDVHDDDFYHGETFFDFAVGNINLASCFVQIGTWELALPALLLTSTIGIGFFVLGPKASREKARLVVQQFVDQTLKGSSEMKTSDKGALHLMISEAIVLTWYRDSKGIWTIGVGHTDSAGAPKRASNPNLTLSLVDALELFKLDLAKYEKRVNEALGGAKVTQAQFDALVSFDYNSGGIFKAALTKSIRAGDFEKAAAGFMGWVKPKEIIGRREKEQALFKTGNYGNLSQVQVYDKKPGKVRSVSTAALLGSKPLVVKGRSAADLKAELQCRGYVITDDITSAVREFQRDNDMRVDGIAGPLTWAELDEAPVAKPPVVIAPPVSEPAAEGKLLIIASVQKLLREKGYPEVGEPDNKFGARTRNAILAFQADNALVLTGEVSDELLAALVKAPARQNAESRENATAKDLKSQGNQTVDIGAWMQKLGVGVIGAMGLGGVTEGVVSFDQIKKGMGDVRALAESLGSMGPWMLGLGIGAAVLYFGSQVIQRQVEAYREGRSV